MNIITILFCKNSVSKSLSSNQYTRLLTDYTKPKNKLLDLRTVCIILIRILGFFQNKVYS